LNHQVHLKVSIGGLECVYYTSATNNLGHPALFFASCA